MSAPSSDAIAEGLSQLCKTLDGQEWVMGRLDLSGKGYTELGSALKAYKHLRYLDASGNDLGSGEKESVEGEGEGEGDGGGEGEGEGGGDDNAEEKGEGEGSSSKQHPLDALCGLTSLLAINFANNAILSFPEGLFLPNVQIANLSGNRLNAVPFNKDSAPALISLDLSENALTEVNGLDGLGALRVLILNGNTVVTSLGDLGSLPALERLVAQGCGLTETAGLEGLSSQCAEIDFSGNQINDLTGFSAAASNLSGLTKLNLAGNALDSLDQLSNLSGLSLLSSVDLSENPIADSDDFKAEVVMRLPSLKTISGEAVTEEDIQAAKDLKKQRKAEAEAAAAAEAEEGEDDE